MYNLLVKHIYYHDNHDAKMFLNFYHHYFLAKYYTDISPSY